ncbi:DCC1-like thiol-disulfide oxidoreductase family protein [Flavobacterium sp. 1355]|uniref:DCC1-like thiol-disulfide oxidoreductase family protein n=1 Tax=Flavobacterium sp. 1355 TaxID=2806571 RepID=UPI001AEB0DE6|nr:DCC1-like thiol-disulfide oxidoreductase family protein [Flavobacterium sp. 1355]MBP1224043.1 putative DCC family thiol-disulfide oxidoreductase YuxK [Flavobacterium sp. 1355]
MKKYLKNAFIKKIDGTGLAIFRITYCLILLAEISQMMYFRSLIFDKIPFLEPAEINFAIPISIWLIAVIFILFGAFTRFFAVINYLMGLILIGSIQSYEYHVFYQYMAINFLMIFIPVSQCFSLDRLFLKLKYSNTTFQYNPPKTVSQIYYFLPVFLAIGLVYFDSFFLKICSHVWINGLGMWLPASMPMMVHTNLSFLLNCKYLMIFLGYVTLLFEAIFLFIFFRKKWRVIAFFIGVGFHLGILILFPIPWFALTVIAVYLLLVPVSWWKRLFSARKDYSTLSFYYDAECPLCIRTKITITHLDWFNKISFKTVQFDSQENQYINHIETGLLLDNIYSVDVNGRVYSGIDTYIQVMKRIFYLYPIALLLKLPGIYYVGKRIYSYIATNRTTVRCTEENCGYNPPNIVEDAKVKILTNLTLADLKFLGLKFLIHFFLVIQLIIIYNSSLIVAGRELIHLKNTKLDNIISAGAFKINEVTKVLFGSTSHSVFLDAHFNGYNHIVAIVYLNKNGDEIWLPLIDRNGQPSYYNYGTNWRKMSFSTNNGNINIVDMNNGVRDFTAFWSVKNGLPINLANAKFLIKVKKIDSLKNWEWEKDFLSKQINKPWMDGGYIEWKNGKFVSHIKEIEKL